MRPRNQPTPRRKPVDGKIPRRKSGNGKFFLAAVLIISAIIGFFAAENAGLTGTSVIFSKETSAPDSPRDSDAKQRTAARRNNARQNEANLTQSDDKSSVSANASAEHGEKSSQKSPSAQKKKSAGTPRITTLPEFPVISQNENSWPTFVKLTRARNIALVDSKTGTAMGRMDIPAGTFVKVSKVLPTGTLVVFDRTGQSFQVSAQGTNFSEAYLAKANKPKKKTKPKKKAEQPKAPVDVAVKPPPPETDVPANPASSTGGASKRISAFGVAEDNSSWGEEED